MADQFTKARKDFVKYGRYRLPEFTGFGPAEEQEKSRGWERATNAAKTISDQYHLQKWMMRMVAKGIATNDGLFALAAATPLSDKKELDDIAYRAKEHAGGGRGANLGTALHSFTERLDRGEDLRVPAPWDRDVEAYRGLVNKAGLSFDPEYMERIVIVASLTVAGKFDRIAKLTRDLPVDMPYGQVILKAGTWVVLDLKTGADLSLGWGDIAIQLGLYANCTALFNPDDWTWEVPPVVDKRIALVVHLPVEKGVATLHGLDIEQGWAITKVVTQVKDWRNNKTLSVPIDLGSVPAVKLMQVELGATVMTYEERILAAKTKDELSSTWREAKANGLWTPALEALGKSQLANISAQAA